MSEKTRSTPDLILGKTEEEVKADIDARIAEQNRYESLSPEQKILDDIKTWFRDATEQALHRFSHV